jgi:hypothetical protein
MYRPVEFEVSADPEFKVSDVGSEAGPMELCRWMRQVPLSPAPALPVVPPTRRPPVFGRNSPSPLGTPDQGPLDLRAQLSLPSELRGRQPLRLLPRTHCPGRARSAWAGLRPKVRDAAYQEAGFLTVFAEGFYGGLAANPALLESMLAHMPTLENRSPPLRAHPLREWLQGIKTRDPPAAGPQDTTPPIGGLRVPQVPRRSSP